MIKALLDINVILDVFQMRKPHYAASSAILSLCEKSEIKGYLSIQSYGTLYYILVKALGKNKALPLLKKLRSLTHAAHLDGPAIDSALDSEFQDFEDAIQYYCATNNGLTHIITRDKKGFAKAKLVIVTPSEFLTLYNLRAPA